MELATLLKNIFLGDDSSGSARDFAKVKRRSEGTFFTLDLDGVDNQLLQYLIWPMNTFHLIARIFDTHDIYQRIVSIENEVGYLQQLRTGNHAKNWSETLLNAKENNKIEISPRFYGLLYSLFSSSKTQVQIEELLSNLEYLSLLFELYIVSDECACRIQNEVYSKSSILISRYVETLATKKSRRVISLSQCNRSNGVIQFKTNTPQTGISLNSLSHDLAYVKPGVEIAAIVGNSIKQEILSHYNVLILPWPLEIKDVFFKQDNRPTLQMEHEFGFFSYENHHRITHQMIIYAIEFSEILLDLVVLPECAVNSNNKNELLNELREYFSEKDIIPPVIIFGIFGDGDSVETYGENSLELLYCDRLNNQYVGENQKKHHRWALDAAQLKNYGLDNVLSLSNVKWWESCSIGARKLISYRDERIHICPLICEDLARQDPIAPVVRALGPDLVIALLLDGPQIEKRWSGRYASALVDEPGCSVLSVSAYGMTQRSTNGSVFEPSSNVALWRDTQTVKELKLEVGKIGILLNLKFEEQRQWSADGRGQNKNRLFYSSHESVGDISELSKLEREYRDTQP
ncbi:hypothetical protein V8687_06870 [Shewanella baltica]|uniref:hypothetical protein n=1 Tax=Shewanella baltica TaxID=62322 RepID=UPI0030D4E224